MSTTISKKKALSEIEHSIRYFYLKKYTRTVRWLQFFRDNLETGAPSSFEKDVLEIFIQYKNDVEEKGKYWADCYNIISKLIRYCIHENPTLFRQCLINTYDFYYDWRKTQENLSNISELAESEEISDKAKYYLYCFVYLISIEGGYPNWLKVLYYLFSNFIGEKTDLSKIVEWKPLQIKQEFQKHNKEYDILFEGYYEGKLRNAIGHGDISYLDDEKVMHFYHVYKGELKLDEKITARDFYHDYLLKIHIVMEICYEHIMLLRLLSYKKIYKKI